MGTENKNPYSSFAKVGCKPIVALFCEQTKNLATKEAWIRVADLSRGGYRSM